MKLKKVEKTTRPFRYNLNQIPCDYTEEVSNRFKGLDLIECLMNCGQKFLILYRRHESRPPSRKKMQKSQWQSEEALQIAVKRREVKRKEKRKDIPI